MGDIRHRCDLYLFVVAGSLPLAAVVDPVVAVLCLPAFMLAQVPYELARWVTARAVGVERPRLAVGVLTLDVVSDSRPDVRQTAFLDGVPPVVSLTLAAAAFAVLPLPYATAVAYGIAAYVFALTGVWRCIWHDTVFEKLRAYREWRRAEDVHAAIAALPEGPARYDAAVALLERAVARDPSNVLLSRELVTRLVMALRPEVAANELARLALHRGIGDRHRRRAALSWADLVLTYPDVLSTRVPTAVRMIRDNDLGCGFHAAYLQALTALRTDAPEVALGHADAAIARWEGGEPVRRHALGSAYGIRAAALLALGRADEARAAIAKGVEYDPGCGIPDVLDEAKAALAA